MELKVFSVYDSKAGFYGNPIYLHTKGEALRTWEDAANDPQSQIGKYPADFTLFEIGEFDNVTGEVAMYESKTSLGTAIEFKKS
jgi:hypothetical protein